MERTIEDITQEIAILHSRSRTAVLLILLITTVESLAGIYLIVKGANLWQ